MSCYSKLYNQHRTDRAAYITWTTLCACPDIRRSIMSTELTDLCAARHMHYTDFLMFIINTELTELRVLQGLHYVHVLLFKVL